MDGGLGADSLKGDAGRDIFVFSSVLGAKNIDAILRFSTKTDTIELSRDVFAGLKKGALNDDAFVIGAEAKDAEDRIVYDARSGALLFDPDGKGGDDAVAFAQMKPGHKLTEKDFDVICGARTGKPGRRHPRDQPRSVACRAPSSAP